jgi:6-pyruvoyltetrahydropterin/6-carboxytetrahydropterin synthase
MRVRRGFDFEAAHVLPRHPGKCRNLHGHSYRLIVTLERDVDRETGFTIDFSELKRIVRAEVIDRLDHGSLNDVMENPTAEHIAEWIWNRLANSLPGLAEIELFETRNCSVVYRGERA